MTRTTILSILLIASGFLAFAQQREFTLISWNIKDFGKTKNAEELNEIAEIVRDADILAIQEVVAGYGGAQAVAKLADILNRKGHRWDYAISDPTRSPKFVTERYALIWKTGHIKTRDKGWLIDPLDPLIDREPFLLHLYLGGQKLTVVDYHSRPYNKDPESEIQALSSYAIDSLTTPVIIAGDFNVEEKKPVFDALKKAGYSPAITGQRTTLKRSCTKNDYLNYPIDNIFYSKGIHKVEGGVIDFAKFCDRLERARKLSDHLPVLLRFRME